MSPLRQSFLHACWALGSTDKQARKRPAGVYASACARDQPSSLESAPTPGYCAGAWPGLRVLYILSLYGRPGLGPPQDHPPFLLLPKCARLVSGRWQHFELWSVRPRRSACAHAAFPGGGAANGFTRGQARKNNTLYHINEEPTDVQHRHQHSRACIA